jgi:phage terminase large subunit
MSKIKIHEKYQPLWTSDARFYVVTGGRGSGKSFAVALATNHQTYNESEVILYTRYTLSSANVSIIPEFVEKIEIMEARPDFQVTKDEIINRRTGSRIMFKGIKTSSGNQTANLKSITGLTTWILDEAEELDDEQVFDKIQRSVRKKGKKNKIIIIMNPSTKDHWVYKRFFETPVVKPGWNGTKGNVCYIHTTYEDNKENLSQDFLQDIFETKIRRPDKYEHEIMGGWKEKADGVIFDNWTTGQFVNLDRMCYGQDFGWSEDLTTLVKVSLDMVNMKLYVKEIFGKANMTTDDIARLDKRYAGSDLIMADSKEARLIHEVRQRGVNIKQVKKKHGSILSGITMMQDLDIVVDPSSEGIIRELNHYVWKNTDTPLSNGNDHYIDAIRYALTKLWVGKNSGKYVIR